MRRLLRLLGRNTPVRPALVERKPREDLDTLLDQLESGDVNPETGHVDFHGDVDVLGGIGDSMRVRADGAVLVGHSVSNALVEAHEGVVVGRNIARSTVVAGVRTARLLELRSLLCPLSTDLERLIDAVRQVQSHPRWGTAEVRHVTIGRVVKLVMEKKLPHVVERVEDVLRFVSGGGADWVDREFLEFSSTLHRRLAGLGPLFVRDMAEIVELHERCRQYARKAEEEQLLGPVVDVVARHVHNSELWASGQIILHRGGCFYSRLWAGTGVTVESGVFRGESVTVNRGTVTMDEAGSPLGTEVRISILEDGVFKARIVHPGVCVTIGGQSYTFRSGARGVRVRLVDGELHVSTMAQMGGKTAGAVGDHLRTASSPMY